MADPIDRTGPTAWRSVATLISKVVAAVIAVMTIWTFFAVKPLPELVVRLQSEQRDQACSLKNDEFAAEYREGGTRGALDRVSELLGQVVFVRLHITADAYFGDEGGEPSGCSLNLNNLSGESGLWGDVDADRAFEVDVDVEMSFYEAIDDFTYTGWPVLLLPNRSSEFISVNLCEAHCFDLVGPVRLQEGFASEGFYGIKFIPVDVYANSYLTARYECRLRVQDSAWPALAPLICAF